MCPEARSHQSLTDYTFTDDAPHNIEESNRMVVGLGQRREGFREIQCYRGLVLVWRVVIDCRSDKNSAGNTIEIQPTPLLVLETYPVHVLPHESGEFFHRRGRVRLSVYFALLYSAYENRVTWVDCEDNDLAYIMFRLFPSGTSVRNADTTDSSYFKSLRSHQGTNRPIRNMREFMEWYTPWKDSNRGNNVDYAVHPTEENKVTIRAAIDEWILSRVSSARDKDFLARFLPGPTHEEYARSAELQQCLPALQNAFSRGILPRKRAKA